MDKYGSINEFVDDLKNFYDLEFKYRGKTYSICPLDGAFVAGEADGEDNMFETLEDLLERFTLEGKPLRDAVLDLEILVR
jgi:hypothetical protein